MDGIFLGPAKKLALNTSKNNSLVLLSTDTVTPNPVRKCFESVFYYQEEKESETCEDTPRSPRTNEAFLEEIIANLRGHFPPKSGLHWPLCAGDDRLRSNHPGYNDYGEKDVKITTAISQNILCLALSERILIMDRFLLEGFLRKIESHWGTHYEMEEMLPYYQSTKRGLNISYFAKHEQLTCARKQSKSKTCEVQFLRAVSCPDTQDVPQYESILVQAKWRSFKISFLKKNNLIRIINCDINEMNRPIQQISGPEFAVDNRITLPEMDFSVCRKFYSSVQDFGWSLNNYWKNPVVNSYMAPTSGKNRNCASMELFPRMALPTDAAPHRVVCQLWKDLTRFSFANSDASLHLSHADFPLQRLEVPVSETLV
ncbi:hypothetical protein AVEN_121938-1 [Araneus ventricosus]|uniref:Uncharacterized protein n=1 Tax=Araneus ventricosus TaxID=182803 RepID=A0A4Y2P4J0_ARAVE|nr:hypothetical protein AVEN_121938-1 [Araneus ventricosus]